MTVLFGAGNFQRAFAAWMLQRGGEPATVVRVTDGGRYGELEAAGWRYPVWTRGLRDGERVDELEWVEAIAEAVYPYEDFGSYLRLAERPDVTTLISNTTEAGIRYEAEARPEGRPAATFPGKLTQWLAHRWRHTDGGPGAGVDVLPCELIDGNGGALRSHVETYARAWGYDPDFTRWLRADCCFVDTLVDRIVTGRPSAGTLAGVDSQDLLAAARTAVAAEPYHLFAIAGAGERLREGGPLRAAGLNVVYPAELAPLRRLKVHLLNGAHTAMVPVGLRHGVETVRDFVEHATWGEWLRGLLYGEIAPTLYGDPASGLTRAEVEAYANTVLERFANPFVEHRLESILLNSLSKWPARLGATVGYYTARGLPVPERLGFAWECQLDLAAARGAAGMPDEPAAVARLVGEQPAVERLAGDAVG